MNEMDRCYSCNLQSHCAYQTKKKFHYKVNADLCIMKCQHEKKKFGGAKNIEADQCIYMHEDIVLGINISRR